MLRSKKFHKPGFTLIEVLFALAIMALVLVPIFITQSNVVRSVGRFSRHIERQMQARLFLLESVVTLKKNDTTKTIEKKITNPATTMKFDLAAVGQDSALKKIKNVSREQVTFEWQEGSAKKSDTITLFVFRPQEKKKEGTV